MSKRILIVEDEPNIAASLDFVLSREGFDVTVVADGGRAIDAINGHPPDVLVLDVMLPARSGFDILKDLRGGDYPGLPVLMLTAKGQAKDRQTAETLGATRFMTKPFSNAEVVSAVKDLAG